MLMNHSYVSSLYHVVFSTKARQKVLSREHRQALTTFFAGVAKNHHFQVLATGGAQDHLHLLLSLPDSMTLAHAVHLLKGESSKFLHEKWPLAPIHWQDNYGAFSVGISNERNTQKYIRDQEVFHYRVSFEEEFKEMLEAHHLEYKEQEVFSGAKAGV